MTLACARCDSTYLIEDYDTEAHVVVGYKCGMCGRNTFIEAEKPASKRVEGEVPLTHSPVDPFTPPQGAQEEGNMPDGYCEVKGCGKSIIKDHRCQRHYIEKHGKSPRKQCEAPDCLRQAVRGGLCAAHYKEVHGEQVGKTWGSYKKKKPPGKPAPTRGVSPLAAVAGAGEFTEIAENVLVPRDVAAVVNQVKSVRQEIEHPHNTFTVLSVIETLVIEDNNASCGDPSIPQHIAEISFRYPNGSRPVFIGARVEHVSDQLTYDDWMFLGAVAENIRRLQEGG